MKSQWVYIFFSFVNTKMSYFYKPMCYVHILVMNLSAVQCIKVNIMITGQCGLYEALMLYRLLKMKGSLWYQMNTCSHGERY